ncbi:MAG: hypothetical protein ACR2HX_18825 [Pyrinomonadaceae bacterium]
MCKQGELSDEFAMLIAGIVGKRQPLGVRRPGGALACGGLAPLFETYSNK